MTDPTDELAVATAVDELVAAFGRGDLDAYFGSFDPRATFVFYTTPRRLEGVAAYRAEWARWVEHDSFSVAACEATDRRIDLWGDLAIVTHSVTTQTQSNAGPSEVHERETIVLHRAPDGRWLGIHEHLSAAPGR